MTEERIQDACHLQHNNLNTEFVICYVPADCPLEFDYPDCRVRQIPVIENLDIDQVRQNILTLTYHQIRLIRAVNYLYC